MQRRMCRTLLLALAAALLTGCYSVSRYSGDGQITRIDSAWCKYIVEFPPIESSVGGEHEFRFSGCPNKTLYFELVLADRTQEPSLDEHSARAFVRLTSSDASGAQTVLFEQDGPLVNDRSPDSQWFGGSPFVLPPSWEYSEPARRAAWAYGAHWIRFNPRSTYTLTISVRTDRAGDGPPVMLTPIIWGGGFMQPENLASN